MLISGRKEARNVIGMVWHVGSLTHQFDWYQATVPAHHELIIRELLANTPPECRRENGKGQWSYAASAALALPDGEHLARVYHGGGNPHPNVSATGDNAQAIAIVLRACFPVHRVSRLDVAVDMQGEGLFDDLVRLMSFTGRQHRLKGEKIIPDDLDDGSTYYLGSRASPVRVRCYEKGKQLHKLTGDPVWRQFYDWTRLELQVRPQKEFKSIAAALAPDAFWGCSPWTRELAAGALAMNPLPVTMKPTRIADHERAMRALTAQYGATILRQVSKLGSWEAYTDDLKHRLGVDQAEAA